MPKIVLLCNYVYLKFVLVRKFITFINTEGYLVQSMIDTSDDELMGTTGAQKILTKYFLEFRQNLLYIVRREKYSAIRLLYSNRSCYLI